MPAVHDICNLILSSRQSVPYGCYNLYFTDKQTGSERLNGARNTRDPVGN